MPAAARPSRDCPVQAAAAAAGGGNAARDARVSPTPRSSGNRSVFAAHPQLPRRGRSPCCPALRTRAAQELYLLRRMDLFCSADQFCIGMLYCSGCRASYLLGGAGTDEGALTRLLTRPRGSVKAYRLRSTSLLRSEQCFERELCAFPLLRDAGRRSALHGISLRRCEF